MLRQLFARPLRRKQNLQDFEPEAIPLIDNFSHNVSHSPRKPPPTSPSRQQQRHSQIMHFTTLVAVTMTAVGLMAPAVAAPVPDSGINFHFGDPDNVLHGRCGGHLPIPCPEAVDFDSSIRVQRQQDSISTQPFDEAVETVLQRQQDNGNDDGYCGGPMRPCGPPGSYRVPERGPAVGWNVKTRNAPDDTSSKDPRNSMSGIHRNHLPIYGMIDWDLELQGKHGGASFQRKDIDTDPENCNPVSQCQEDLGMLPGAPPSA